MILALGVALLTAACGSVTSGAKEDGSEVSGSALSTELPVNPSVPIGQEIVIPNGTLLVLLLTTPVGSDTSIVEDAVSAELRQSVEIDGRVVLPAGTKVTGSVTGVDGAGRVTGRATIGFRFTSIQAGGEQYDLLTAPISQMVPAAGNEDMATIGIDTDTGALIGGLLSGVDGGVVLATRGEEVRLESGAEVVTELTSSLTVRVPVD